LVHLGNPGLAKEMTLQGLAKILVIDELNCFGASSNGVNNVIFDFIKFGQKDFKFYLAGLGAKEDVGTWKTISPNGVSVLYFTVAESANSVRNAVLRSLPASLRIVVGLIKHRKKLNMKNFDFVQVHRVEIGAFLAIVCNIKPVQFIHNAKENLTGRNSDSIWRHFGFLYGLLERLVLRHALGIGVFNQKEARRLSNLSEVVVRCRTWYDSQVFYPITAPKVGKTIRLVWVGRLDEQKNPMLAIEVLSSLSELGVDAELHFFGDGPLKLQLHEHAARENLSNAIFHGSVEKTILAREVRMSDILLMTSHYEGSPTVLVEALGSGVPAVANKESDPDLLIQNGVNGQRVSISSPTNFAEALVKAAELNSVLVAKSVKKFEANAMALPTLMELHRKN
jgi:glycosyltransferase involved in cell wall biosynthesis